MFNFTQQELIAYAVDNWNWADQDVRNAKRHWSLIADKIAQLIADEMPEASELTNEEYSAHEMWIHSIDEYEHTIEHRDDWTLLDKFAAAAASVAIVAGHSLIWSLFN